MRRTEKRGSWCLKLEENWLWVHRRIERLQELWLRKCMVQNLQSNYSSLGRSQRRRWGEEGMGEGRRCRGRKRAWGAFQEVSSLPKSLKIWLWAQNDLLQISPSLPSCAYQLTSCTLISSLVSGMQTPEISKFLCAKALTYVINISPPPESKSHWPQGTLLPGELLIGPQQDIGGRRCHHNSEWAHLWVLTTRQAGNSRSWIVPQRAVVRGFSQNNLESRGPEAWRDPGLPGPWACFPP